MTSTDPNTSYCSCVERESAQVYAIYCHRHETLYQSISFLDFSTGEYHNCWDHRPSQEAPPRLLAWMLRTMGEWMRSCRSGLPLDVPSYPRGRSRPWHRGQVRMDEPFPDQQLQGQSQLPF